jgi:hypothetical protein
MKEKFAQLMETLKANKGVAIRVVGVVLGAAVGVAVASMVVAAQEGELMLDESLEPTEDDLLDTESE